MVGRLTEETFSDVLIPAYGERTPLAQLVQFIPKGATTLTLNVYDEKMIPHIQKVLETSDKSYQIKKDQKMITVTLLGGNTKESKNEAVK